MRELSVTEQARYEAEDLGGSADRSHRPRSCPHQTSADVEAVIATLRSSHPNWGPRRLVHELGRACSDEGSGCTRTA